MSPAVVARREWIVIDIEINVLAARHWIDAERLVEAAREVLRGEGIDRAAISLAVVDDPTIHDLNRRHLRHDYATDVLSFVLDDSGGRLEGEVIVSADTAESAAREFGWLAADELLLYVIHGALHLAGHDDQDSESRNQMRQKETEYLRRLGVERPQGDVADATCSNGGNSP